MMRLSFLIKRTFRTNSNTIQWNKTIQTHQTNRNYQQALKLFQMGIEKNSFQPNSVTYLTMLDICKELKSLTVLRDIHRLIETSKSNHADVQFNPRIRSLLMDAYIKCQDIDSAHRVFQSMTKPNLIDYSGLMTAFNHNQQYEKTIDLSKQIPIAILSTSPILCTLILQSCTKLNFYEYGLKIHEYGQISIENDELFMNELINFYLNFHQEQHALELFNKYYLKQTIINFSLLMKYYNRQYEPQKTIDLYFRLKNSTHMKIDHIIYVLVLQAIADGCFLNLSQQIQEHINKYRTHLDIQNALINMYGKLGDLNKAEEIFHSMTKQNIVSYNILLNLYGLYHRSDKALKCFQRMCEKGHQPDDKTYVLLLHALSKTSNRIHDVKRIYSNVKETERGPMLKSAMIAALIRAELYDDVRQILKEFPNESILFYSIKANINRTHDTFVYPITITDEQIALYDLLMSNIYNYGGLHDQFSIISQYLTKNDRLKSMLTKSFYEKKSNNKLEYIETSQHAEQIAIEKAFEEYKQSALPILIGKNLRTCDHCHEYIKTFSLSTPERQIILRDSTRFHLFLNGKCSCEIDS